MSFLVDRAGPRSGITTELKEHRKNEPSRHTEHKGVKLAEKLQRIHVPLTADLFKAE